MPTLARSLVSLALALAAAAAAAAGVEPKVVMEIKGGMLRGPDAPVFALYNDGLVIFRAPEGKPPPSGFRAARLSRDRYQALVGAIAPDEMLALADSYDAISGTDPLAYVIHAWISGRRKTVSVSGHLWDAASRAKAPPAFLRAHDAIGAFAAPGAPPWVPATIEIALGRNDHAPGEAVRWPQGWPAPEKAPADRDGIRRLSLPGTQFDLVRKLFGAEYQRGAMVQIGKSRWYAQYRLPFPSESMWPR